MRVRGSLASTQWELESGLALLLGYQGHPLWVTVFIGCSVVWREKKMGEAKHEY